MFRKRLELLVVIYFSAILFVLLFDNLYRTLRPEPFYYNNVTGDILVLRRKIPIVAYKDISEFEETIQKLVDEGKLSADADFTRRGYIARLEDVLSPEQRKKMIFSGGLPLTRAEGMMKTKGCKTSKIAFFSSKSGEVVLYACTKGILDARNPFLFYYD
jgi:hypothetical protein